MKLLDLFNFRNLKMEPPSPRSAVVALGGGGARGVAHLGVMQAIGESGVQTERIVGVSMGSLAGAMCAVDSDIPKVQAKAIELLRSPIFRHKQQLLFGARPSTDEECSGGLFSWYGRIRKFMSNQRRLGKALTGPSLLPAAMMEDLIDYLLPDVDIEDLPTPLSVVAADLLSGHKIVLETGSLRMAIRASTAIPGVFPPVAYRDMLLCDIGVLDSVPISIAKSYASDMTIAVDVGQDHGAISECKSALDVMMRMDDIGERIMRRYVLPQADLVIRPEVGNIAWFDFSEPEELIDAGHKAAHVSIATLLKYYAA